MKYPLAWFLTWTTYGTWLHGDARGSHIGSHPLPPNPELEASMRAEMTEDVAILTDVQRALVGEAIVRECANQGWFLHARNVRTNHVHVVVSASAEGSIVLARLKAVASNALSDQAGLPMTAGRNGRRRWWTEKGNKVPVEHEAALAEFVQYVSDLQ